MHLGLKVKTYDRHPIACPNILLSIVNSSEKDYNIFKGAHFFVLWRYKHVLRCLPAFSTQAAWWNVFTEALGYRSFNTLRPRQNGRPFTDDIFICIFLNENIQISIRISLKFVPKSPIYNIPALVQIMAWRRPGDKPLSEPMMIKLLTHICITWPQWVKIASTSGYHVQDITKVKLMS